MISSAGIGSGLDINGIIAQIMQLEQIPLKKLEAKQQSFEDQISSYGKIKSALSKFQDAAQELNNTNKFNAFSATSADEAIFTTSASSGAQPGSYQIEVLNLAVAHKQASTAFADFDTTTIGTAGDTATFQVGTDPANSFTVDIGGKTLSEIRTEINEAADNVGVTATIVTEDTGSRLILTSDETGTANSISTSYSGADLLGLSDVSAAEDAVIEVDGFTATRSSNAIADVIGGITLNLQGESTPGSTTQLSVEQDVETLKANVQAFVDTYNELNDIVKLERIKNLEGDNTLLSLENQLMSTFNTAATGLTGGISYLAEVGVTFQKSGDLSLDEAEFESALATNSAGVAQLFGDSSEGFATRLDSLVQTFLDPDGLLDSKTDGLNASIDRVERRIDDMSYRLQVIEERIRARFTALDTFVAQSNSTSSYLAQQLANLQGTTGKS
ncbi:MAG: flagellar filament capping protein FliD [Thioalkalispiraceae bacterium]|jgi:flagellar hook-associated protein 2